MGGPREDKTGDAGPGLGESDGRKAAGADGGAGTTEWCAGFRLESRRDLTPEERAELEREARRFLVLGWGTLTLSPLLLLALWAVLVSVPNRESLLWGFFSAATMFIFVGGMMAALLWGRDWLGLRAMACRDLVAGMASRFAGTIHPDTAPDSVQGILLNRRFLRAGTDEDEVLEVLDGSGRLWRVNGTRVRRRLILPRARVAETPAFAGIAADWVQPVDPDEPGAPYLNDREMSQPEHTEIEGLVRGVLWENLPGLLLLNGWAAWVAWDNLVDPAHPATVGAGVGAVVVAALWVLVAWRDLLWYRRLQVARAFNRDRRVGRIVIARMPVAPPDEAERAAPRLSPPEEYLPISHALWTVDGVPAPWRRGLSLRPRKAKP